MMNTIYKLTLAVAISCFTFLSCGDGSSDPSCGSYNGKTLHKGPQGGCYYINGSGNKEYVDRSLCKC